MFNLGNNSSYVWYFDNLVNLLFTQFLGLLFLDTEWLLTKVTHFKTHTHTIIMLLLKSISYILSDFSIRAKGNKYLKLESVINFK